MNEYITAMKVKPDEKNRVIKMEFYSASAVWSGENEYKIVSSVIVPQELLQNFFIVRQSFLKRIRREKDTFVKRLKKKIFKTKESKADLGMVI